ncbi:hypothetical protein [Microbispora sp. ATCC PTA-5024]|uniref:hypothetical protein n=1 Tax=Microbispora sp. ATCC PTA-5024 TaxID=316330 RepID=UPI0003DC9D4B|nr:hypothetical protein [Microbispora sp. ATCC PTA-5024]ETK34051.1 anti-sigma factor [Microbispora sp. ATCC PTA-5024]
MIDDEDQDALTAAVREADEELIGPLTVPAYDELLGRLPDIAGHRKAPVTGPTLRASWRLTTGLVRAQARLIPRSLGPLTALGLVAAVLLARTAPTPGAVVQLFSSVVTVVLLLGSVTACSHRSDPRLELLSAMPVSPATAFATRLALVLGIDLALSVVASGVLVSAGATTGMLAVVAGWLGRALLAAGAGAVFAIWRSPAFGTMAGVVVWLLGWVRGPDDAVVSGTHPWMLSCALALLAAAVWLARRPRLSGSDG